MKTAGTTAGFLLLPFFVLFWITPFISSKTIGNDYPVYSINNQMELLFSVKTGSFPLFVPGYDGGLTSYALSLGEIFHPIAWFASLMPEYWGGLALEWNTLFRLLSLGAAHLFLFLFLRRIKISVPVAFAGSFMAVYNLRMLDLLRYGASLESWTGMLFLMAAIGFCVAGPGRLLPFFAIAGSAYWLTCSGHPQMAYYGFMGAGLWLVIIPFFVKAVLGKDHVSCKSMVEAWGISLAGLAAGIALSSHFTVPYALDFLANNVERTAAAGYAWADQGRDTLWGTLNNFVQPFGSDVGGAFAGSSLFLAVALLPLAALVRVRIPGAVWAAWWACAFAFAYMQGARLPVHYLAWKYLPFAGSMHIAGRITMIMPPLFMLVFIWCAQAAFTFRLGKRSYVLTPLNVLCAMALAAMAAWACMVWCAILPPPSGIACSQYCPFAIRRIPVVFALLTVLAGVLTLAAGMLFRVHDGGNRGYNLVTVSVMLLIVVQTTAVLCYGTWINQKHPTPSFAVMAAQKRERLDFRNFPGGGLYDKEVLAHINRHALEPFLAKIYGQCLYVKSNREAYEAMERDRTPFQAVVEAGGPLGTPAVSDWGGVRTDSVRLIYSSFNRMVFETQSSSTALLGVAVPFSHHWRAAVNGREAPTYRTNGYALGVPLTKGRGIIELRYRSSAATAGMVISCLFLFVIGVILPLVHRKSKARLAAGLAICLFAIGIFILWHGSFYTGKNLETAYVWSTGENTSAANVAYGKASFMSSILNSATHWYCSGRALDGDRRPGSGFLTALENSPSWTVDLQEERPIDSVVLYGKWGQAQLNSPPLQVATSPDLKNWTRRWTGTPQDTLPLRIRPETAGTARYVRISAAGRCWLSIDEVELYTGHQGPSARPAAASGRNHD